MRKPFHRLDSGKRSMPKTIIPSAVEGSRGFTRDVARYSTGSLDCVSLRFTSLGMTGFERLRVHSNEKLLERAKNDGRFRAPAVGIAVLVNLLAQQRALFAQQIDHVAIGIEHVFPRPDGHADFFGEAAFFI